MTISYVYDDGGRTEAGFRGTTGDCVTRAIAIVTGLPYREVYDELHARALADRNYIATLTLRYGANARRHTSPRTGVPKKIYEPYLESLGFHWTPTMRPEQSWRMHVRGDELPRSAGPLILRLSRHLAAYVDGQLRDNSDCSRDGGRMVYGVYSRDPVAVLDELLRDGTD